MAFRIVGAVGIKVRPDTGNFREETKTKLKAETKGLKASVRIDPDTRALETKARLAVAELNQKLNASNISVRLPLTLDTDQILSEATKAAQQVTRRLRSTDASIRPELDTSEFDRNLSRLVNRARTAGRSVKEQLEGVRAQIIANVEASKADIERIEAEIKAIGDQDLDLSVDLSPEDMAANRAKIEAFRQEIEAKKVEIDLDLDRFREASRALTDMAQRADQVRNTDITPRFNRDAIDSDLNHIIRRSQTEAETVQQSLKRVRADIEARIDLKQSELRRIQESIKSIRAEIEVDPTMPTGRKNDLLTQVEALKKEAERTRIDIQADVDRSGRASAALANLTRARRAELTITMGRRVKDDVLQTLDAITGAQTIKDVTRFFESMAVNADKVAMAAVAGISGVTAMAGTLLHATGGITTFIGQLGQIGGLAVAIPGLFVGWKVLGSTFSLIFDQMGAALKGNEKALARFSDTAQGYIVEFREAYDDLRHTVQDEFYNNIGPTVLRTLDQTFPIIKQGFADVAKTGALLIRNAFFTLDELGRKGSIKQFFDNLNVGLREAAPGLDHIVDAFATLVDFGGGRFPEIGRFITDIGTKFDLLVGRASAQNKLAVWFETAKVRAGQLWDGIKDLAGTFQAISDAAHRAGYDGLASFQDLMSRIRDTVTGPKFQETMTTLFEGARLGAKKFFEQVQPISDALLELAPTISQGFIDVADGIGSLLGDISNAFAESDLFKSGLGNLFMGFRDGLKAFGDYLPTISDGLGSLGTVLGDMFRGFTPILGGAVASVAGAFSSMQPSLSALAPDMASVAQSVVDIASVLLNMGTTPLSMLVDFFVALPAPMQAIVVFAKPLTSFLSTVGPLIGAAVGKIAAMAGTGPGGIATLKKVATIGFGVAAGGLLWFLAQAGEDARKAESETRKVINNAQELAKQQVQNPTKSLGEVEGATKNAIAAADELDGKFQVAFDRIRNATGVDMAQAFGPINKQGLVDIYLGTDSASADATRKQLEGIRNKMAELEGTDFDRGMNKLLFWSDAGESQQILHDTGVALDAFRDQAAKTREEVAKYGQSDAGRFDKIVGAQGEAIEKFGKITLQNVPDIESNIQGLNTTFDSASDLGQIMATSLGGSAREIDSNARMMATALRQVGDSPCEMTKFLTGMGFNKTEIEKVFTGLGYSTQEFEEAFRFSLGSVGDVYKNTGAALVDQVPLFRQGSDGITELSRELSSRTNLDASFLSGMLRDTGLSAEDLGNKMAMAGTPITVIKDVLGELGYPAETVQKALESAGTAAQTLTGEGTWSTYAVMGFTTELGKVAEAGGDAAAKADALRNAIDRLNGSPIATDRLEASFNAAVDQAKELFEVTEGETAKDWSNIVDSVSGKINTMTQQGRDLQAQTDSLSREAWALASDTFSRVYQQTGDIDKATQAARGSIEQQIQAFKDMAVAAGIPEPAIDALLGKYQLWPEQVATDVRINAVDAQSGLQAVVGLLGQTAAGATANVGVIDDTAKAKLEELGVKLEAVGDGTYRATLDADPTKARAQIDGFTQWASVQGAKVPVDANTNPAMNAVQDAVNKIGQLRPELQIAGYVRLSRANGATALADGGILNGLGVQLFANGGISGARVMNALRGQVKTFASGGVERHDAHIAKTLRIFAEPETGGEAYIPLSPAKRARSTRILHEVADRFGYELRVRNSTAYADGGFVAPPQAEPVVSDQRPIQITQYYPVAEKTSVANARAGQLIGAIGD